MNIVIIGEYSGFAKNLNLGFRKIGHRCLTFSWGDTFKRIMPDDNTYLIDVSNIRIFGKDIKGSHIIRRIISNIKLRYYLKEHFRNEKADVVLILNPAFLKKESNHFQPLFSKTMILNMLRDPNAIYMSACGSDYISDKYLPYRKKVNEYGIFKKYKNLDIQEKNFVFHLSYIHNIIPVMYDYSSAYRFFKDEYDYNLLDTIPLPFDISSVKTHNEINGRIKIMHGVSRPYDKGSYIIIAALNKLKKKYDNIVEINIVWRVPLQKYLQIMEDTNIIIDQCYAMGYGMNTIEALAMGKVVLSGNEEENQKEFGVSYNPIISIGPSSENIYERLEELINDPCRIKELSEMSRKYAEEIHNCSLVAQKYIRLFNNHN